jgi:hypothetical protein
MAGVWRVLTLVAITVAWVPFRSPNLHKASSILASMLLRVRLGTAYNSTFYAFTVIVAIFCGIEPFLLSKLSEVEERAGANGPSMFRILGRPLAYTCGLLIFMLFDENNSQFIYSQF